MTKGNIQIGAQATYVKRVQGRYGSQYVVAGAEPTVEMLDLDDGTQKEVNVYEYGDEGQQVVSNFWYGKERVTLICVDGWVNEATIRKVIGQLLTDMMKEEK